MKGPVVVGTDGSQRAHSALVAGAYEAARRGVELVVIHAFAPMYGYVLIDPLPLGEAALRCQEILDSQVREVADLQLGIEVTGRLLYHDPAESLLEAAKEASLLVLGSRGSSTARRLILGSVAAKVATFAPCPVRILSYDSSRARTGMVVGISPEDGSPSVLEYAIEYAQLHHQHLCIVQAYQHSSANLGQSGSDYISDLLTRRSERASDKLRRQVEQRLRAHNAQADFEILPEHAVDALATLGRHCRTVIVGDRRASHTASSYLGSVAQGVLQCVDDVLIVPSMWARGACGKKIPHYSYESSWHTSYAGGQESTGEACSRCEPAGG